MILSQLDEIKLVEKATFIGKPFCFKNRRELIYSTIVIIFKVVLCIHYKKIVSRHF